MKNGEVNVTDETTRADETIDTRAEADVLPASDSPEVPARKMPSGRTTSVLVLAAVVLAVAVYGVWFAADQRWGRRAMVKTAIAGVEALIEGNADQLAALSNGSVKAQLTPALRSAMSNSGILGEFGTPRWNHDSAEVTATTGMGPGVMIVGPAVGKDGVVLYRTMGGISFTNGALSLQRTWGGWQITGLSVTASQIPTGALSAPPTSSVSPTSSAPATTTP
jgi:hypothetical protein